MTRLTPAWVRGLEQATDADRMPTTQPLGTAASTLQVDTIEVMHLAGQRGVFTDEDFSTDALQTEGGLDFASQVIDWVGLTKNPGA